MKFSIKTITAEKVEADLLIFLVWEGKLKDIFVDLGVKLPSVVKEAAEREEFKGKVGDSLVLYTKGLIGSYKLLILGLGKEDEFDLYQLRKSIAISIKKAMQIKAVRVALVPTESWFKQFDVTAIGQAIVEGASLGGYQFFKYKGLEEKERQVLIEHILILAKPNKVGFLEKGVNIGNIFSQATIYARDLVNEPAAVTTPSYLALEAVSIAKSGNGSIKVKIYDKEEVEKMGMNSYLGVAKGSDEPPKFIVLTYRGGKPKGKIIVIGKGITFDTGGLSLKPPEHMETMKLDMAGGAAVLGIFKALVALKPTLEVVGIIAACENMPSGSSLRPGDILKALNGKTIEVLNTDAEGRLTLADSLSYAVKLKPDAIIDMATLTGACMVALGQEIAGLWGNESKLIEKVKKAADLVGEKVWPMPLEKEYKELIKSHIADVKNIQTGRYGGAITAALFLEEFVEDRPWVHLDIAGPAYEEKDTYLVPQGGSGFGVRTVLQFLLNY